MSLLDSTVNAVVLLLDGLHSLISLQDQMLVSLVVVDGLPASRTSLHAHLSTLPCQPHLQSLSLNAVATVL